MQVKPDIPDAYKLTSTEVRTPIINDQIQRLVANLCVNPIRWKVPPPGSGDRDQRRSTKMEKACTGIWDALNRQSRRNLQRRFTDKQVETGEGIYQVLYKPDAWDAMPDREKDEDSKEYLKRVSEFKRVSPLPVSVRVVDRRNWYPVMKDRELNAVFEITTRMRDDLQYELSESDADNDASLLDSIGAPVPTDDQNVSLTEYRPGSQVTLLEYWDKKYAVYIMVHGQTLADAQFQEDIQILRAFEHAYPRIPYFNALGEETSSDDPNYEAVSSAYPVMYLAPFLDIMYTMWANVGYLTGFPTLKERTAPQAPLQGDAGADDEDGEPLPIEFEPGSIIRGGPGTDYDVLDFGSPAESITKMVGELKGLISSVQLPGVMQGIPPGSRTAGYAIQELAQAAKAKYQGIVENSQVCHSEMMNFILWIIENRLKDSIFILCDHVDEEGKSYKDYLEFGPSDIKGYYNVQAIIQPRNPVDRQMEGTFMMNMHAGGAVSLRAVREDGLGIENPEEMEDEMLIEEMMSSPEVRQLLIQKAMEKSGNQALVEEMMAAQQALQQQMALQGGVGSGQIPAAFTNGNPGGVMTPGQGAVQAPTAPRMETPGMPSGIGQDMALQQPQAMGQLPRQYSQNTGGGRTPGARPGVGQRPSPTSGPSVRGFRG